ncbi:hypothetical protein PPACK8108_LOCUS16622 [Phakopsora pachyrhizi]|uniref:DUF6534 domain-containing protein n=1 Tax=Phakopsora pachyrhizi TaxID=170000 RepID=A0AAV0B9K8_PHAPC|nr:hypothetical protein PPACK8108_LOCUS16622 [Phakopsora pachyrhizi]
MRFILPGFLTGGYVTTWIGGMVLGETIRVLYSFPNDPRWLRMLVAVNGLLSIIHIGQMILETYSLKAFESMIELDVVTPHLGSHILLSRIIITMSQLFYCQRLWIFSNKNIPVTVTSVLLSIFHLAASCLTAQKFIEAKLYTKLFLLTILYLLYSSAIACDILITGALVFFLAKQKSQFLKTQSMIKRIMLLSFQSSFVTTALAVVSVVILGHVDLGALYALTLVGTQLYVLSFLITLNSRTEFAKAWASEGNKSLNFSQQVTFWGNEVKRLPYEGVGVRVDQVVMTDVDAEATNLNIPKFAKVRPRTADKSEPTNDIPLYEYFSKDMNVSTVPLNWNHAV